MFIFTAIALLALIVAIASTIMAIKGNHRFYWLAAIATYIFSMIAGFSIGQMTVGITFVLLALAIASSLNLLKNKYHFMTWLGVGFLVGALLIMFVDDAWLFFPLSLLS